MVTLKEWVSDLAAVEVEVQSYPVLTDIPSDSEKNLKNDADIASSIVVSMFIDS